jgi:hypothetical protein
MNASRDGGLRSPPLRFLPPNIASNHDMKSHRSTGDSPYRHR